MARRFGLGLVVVGCTLASGIACITPPPESAASEGAKDKASSGKSSPAAKGKQILWDGEGKGATAKGWASCAKKEGCKATLDTAAKVGRDGSTGLKFHVDGPEWTGMGWNWFGWWPETAGTDISKQKALSFFIRVQAKTGDDAPEYASFAVKLVCSGKGKKGTAEVNIGAYTDDLSDGKWHEVVIPLAELYKGSGAEFDPKTAWEFDFSTYAQKPKTFDVFIDDIAVDNREVLAWISLPVARAPAPLGKDPAVATAEVNLDAAGTPINPLIYGVSHGDQEVLREMGVTTRRIGGNTLSPYDWKTGFTSLGADWFFQNHKNPDTKHPEHNLWADAFPLDKKYGIASYFTLPSMGWVAKDDTSNGFPKSKYPDQMDFAGDRPEAGNGKMLAKDKDGKPIKNEKGEPKIIELRTKDGDSVNGKKVTPEEQTDLLKYSIEKSGFGKAKDGGIKYIVLDNEPMIWTGTHRDMVGFTMGYEDFWEHFLPYAKRLKQIDPDVQIAGPALWGWTAYFYSAKDSDYAAQTGKWDSDKLPEYAIKHGKVPFLKWWIAQVGEYKKKTGQSLFDIMDVHMYSCMKSIDVPRDKAANNPEVMDARLDRIKSLWDPTYRTKDTWIGEETKGQLAVIRLMKDWIAAGNPGMKLAIGEYEWSGWDGGYDVSGAVAQVEVFRVYAQEGVDMAYYWASPKKNSPVYFAFKMLRNPDGKHTPIGDVLLPAKVSAPDDVQAFVTRDAKDKSRLSFVILTKHVAKGAKVTIKLSAALPKQTVIPYEFSGVDIKAIGQLPEKTISGNSIEIEVPPMSVIRFDAKR